MNFGTLKVLLGWDDASTDEDERLITCAGELGLVVDAGVIEFLSRDRWSGEVIRTRITGPWSFGTIHAMAMHLEMIHMMSDGSK